ncbi:hypothetical protein, partial [Vibrio sp. V39_P1S14PM300]|uniref:hypothetical protein n=2 Tax=Vibrio TaxID=662 RepID=UPI00137246B8
MDSEEKISQILKELEDKLRRKHEDSVIEIFRKRVEKLARREKKTLISAPLDGQDRELGADFFITEGTRFAIFEFKYKVGDIVSENDKPLRKTLCETLQGAKIPYNQHINCHYIAW